MASQLRSAGCLQGADSHSLHWGGGTNANVLQSIHETCGAEDAHKQTVVALCT